MTLPCERTLVLLESFCETHWAFGTLLVLLSAFLSILVFRGPSPRGIPEHDGPCVARVVLSSAVLCILQLGILERSYWSGTLVTADFSRIFEPRSPFGPVIN